MNENKEIICTICPEGCHITLDASSSEIRGFKCKRGRTYALNEFTAPVRVLTTTVRVTDGEMPMAPVRSGKPLPKGMLGQCMEVINSFTAQAPVRIGDALIEDILGTGVDIIATGNVYRGRKS